jgi:hypothetical protein
VIRTLLTDHLFDNNLHNPCQSANVRERSTGTELQSVYDDIIKTNSTQQVICLALLYRPAASDTIDRFIMFERLSSCFGSTPIARSWMQLYLLKHQLSVRIQGSILPSYDLIYSVPQESVLDLSGCEWDVES